VNKNHDPRTGKFTSSSGFNRSNATPGERIRGTAAGHARSLGRFGKDLALGTVAAAQEAVFEGVSHAVRSHVSGRVQELLQQHSPAMEAAAVRHTSTILTASGVAGRAAAAGARLAFGHVSAKLGDHAAALKKHLIGESKLEEAATSQTDPKKELKRSAMWQHQEPLKPTPKRRTLVIDQPFLTKARLERAERAKR
jgi:hypothetical protein